MMECEERLDPAPAKLIHDMFVMVQHRIGKNPFLGLHLSPLDGEPEGIQVHILSTWYADVEAPQRKSLPNRSESSDFQSSPDTYKLILTPTTNPTLLKGRRAAMATPSSSLLKLSLNLYTLGSILGSRSIPPSMNLVYSI